MITYKVHNLTGHGVGIGRSEEDWASILIQDICALSLTICGTHLCGLVGSSVEGQRTDREVFHLFLGSTGGLEWGVNGSRGNCGVRCSNSNSRNGTYQR